MQAYIWWRWGPTRPVQPRSHQKGQWMSARQWSTPNLFQKENVKLLKNQWLLYLHYFFDHFHASMTKYSHLLAAITLFLSDCLYSFIVLKCNCFSLAQRLLGQCCRVHVALQSRDKIQDLRRRPSCKEGMDHSNVSNQRNAQLGWQMLKFRVGIHVRCSVSQTTWDTRLGVQKRTAQLESKSANR